MDKGSTLLSPLKLGRHKLKNRIVFGPHRTNRAECNSFSDWHIEYYRERARGGVGLIVTEGGCVLPFANSYEKALNVWAKGTIEGYKRIGQAVHENGSLVVAQLNHYGCQSNSGIGDRELWAPSPIPELNSGEVPKVMEEEDIEEVIAGFASSAEKISSVGLDGVEINIGQYSLLRQFLSPLTNLRTDKFGGVLENRARISIETLSRVRQKLGSELLLGVRLCGDEYAPWAGLTPEHCGEVARYLCEHPDTYIDYITVEVGSIFSVNMTMASMRHPEDYALNPARIIQKEVSVPVCATGSIVRPDLAESIVGEGIALVDMTRALIADPQLPIKYSNKLKEKIRPCILCNQGCFTHSATNPPLSCAMNPQIEFEGCYPKPKKVRQFDKKNIFVIGGGPAGLGTAAAAAERGHRVALFEKLSVPGGRLRLAAKLPGNQGFARGIDYLCQIARDHGVEFRLNCEFSQTILDEEVPDAIVLATGSKPSPVSLKRDPEAVVFRPEIVLEDPTKISGNVLIIDMEGSWPAIGTASLLVNRVSSIQIVSPDFFVCSQLAANGEFVRLYQEACQKGIKFMPQTEVTEIRKNSIEVIDKFSKQKEIIDNIDVVILASPNYPQNDLYKKLLGQGIEIWTAGDCVAPRSFAAAVREGFQIGTRI